MIDRIKCYIYSKSNAIQIATTTNLLYQFPEPFLLFLLESFLIIVLRAHHRHALIFTLDESHRTLFWPQSFSYPRGGPQWYGDHCSVIRDTHGI